MKTWRLTAAGLAAPENPGRKDLGGKLIGENCSVGTGTAVAEWLRGGDLHSRGRTAAVVWRLGVGGSEVDGSDSAMGETWIPGWMEENLGREFRLESIWDVSRRPPKCGFGSRCLSETGHST